MKGRLDSWKPMLNWAREHPLYVDAVVAVVILITQIGFTAAVGPVGSERDADGVAYALIAATSLALVWRRIKPLPVLVVVTGLVMAFWVSDYAGSIDFSMWFAFFSATSHGGPDRRKVWQVTGTCIAIATITAVIGVIVPTEDLPPAAVPAVVFFQGTAAVVGEAAYQRRQKITLLEQRAQALESDLDNKSRLAALDERSRIAREMHDIVAHGMTSVVVQAGAGRRVVNTDPAAAAEAFAHIEQIGRQSVQDIRRMLGLLRDEHREVELQPQPSLDDYHQLVEGAREAGVEIEFEVTGEQRPLPPGLELTGYRIIQEALTNVIRHAGRPVKATVSVRYGEASMVVEIVDDGLGAAAPVATSDSSGHGILGMAERADLYGGTVLAKPRPGGGFGVVATLPIPTLESSKGMGT